RIKAAAAALAVLFVTAWPFSPALRCRLGSGLGCAAAAIKLESSGDHEEAAAYGERGCDRDFGPACTAAGMALQIGPDAPARRARAGGLSGRACALEDEAGCARVHVVELEKRCDRYSATACQELADDYARGRSSVGRDQAASQRYYQKACLLGADEACRRR